MPPKRYETQEEFINPRYGKRDETGVLPSMSPEATDDSHERTVLGIMFFSSVSRDVAISKLQTDDFRVDIHQKIFDALTSLHRSTKPVNPIGVLREIESREKLCDEMFIYVNGLWSLEPHAMYIDYWVDLVLKASVRRKFAWITVQHSLNANNPAIDIVDKISELNGELNGLLDRSAGETEKTTIAEILIDAMSRVGAAKQNGVHVRYPSLDEITYGFQPGHLILLGARPGIGKTALACNFALNAASDGKPVTFFSLEQSTIEVAERMLAIRSHLDSSLLKTNDMDDAQRDMLLASCNEISMLPIRIIDRPSMTVSKISAFAKMRARSDKTRLIIVDYLQLIEPEDKRVNREQQVATVSRQMKNLAKELNIPILMLVQLNRKATEKEGGEPELHHLRESGSLEQDANIVMFLHRPFAYQDDHGVDRQSETTLIVRKHRDGRTGRVDMQFIPSQLRFLETDSWEVNQHEAGVPVGDRTTF